MGYYNIWVTVQQATNDTVSTPLPPHKKHKCFNTVNFFSLEVTNRMSRAILEMGSRAILEMGSRARNILWECLGSPMLMSQCFPMLSPQLLTTQLKQHNNYNSTWKVYTYSLFRFLSIRLYCAFLLLSDRVNGLLLNTSKKKCFLGMQNISHATQVVLT